MITLESLRAQCCDSGLEPGNLIIVNGVPGRFVRWIDDFCTVQLFTQSGMIVKTVDWTSVERYITDDQLRTLFM